MSIRETKLEEFNAYVQSLKGDEKGEAQVFCDRLFQAFGHAGYRNSAQTTSAGCMPLSGTASLAGPTTASTGSTAPTTNCGQAAGRVLWARTPSARTTPARAGWITS